MQITRGYKTELDLNNQQITACKKHAGVARFAYNWGLKRRQEVYRQTGRSISALELHWELNALKQTDFPWMYDSDKKLTWEIMVGSFFSLAVTKILWKHPMFHY